MRKDCDLLETPLEDLKTFVHQILNPPQRKSEPLADASDADDTVKLRSRPQCMSPRATKTAGPHSPPSGRMQPHVDVSGSATCDSRR